MFDLTPSGPAAGIGAGPALGFAYTLSPLTVWFSFGFLLLSVALVRGLDAKERRILLAIFIVAMAVRVMVVVGERTRQTVAERYATPVVAGQYAALLRNVLGIAADAAAV